MTPAPPEPGGDLRSRVAAYLRAHHTMTLATVGPLEVSQTVVWVPEASGNAPHAASVFYAVDDSLRLIFLSKRSSLHGVHIGRRAAVAVTVAEDQADWETIQGVQAWGEARLLTGLARTKALSLYIVRFPFVADFVKSPRLASLMKGIGVYRVELRRFAFTDNTTGVFGRELLDGMVQ